MNQSKPLTAKQAAFAREYVANGFNATRAAISAGYGEDGARVEGTRLLANANVQKKITELMQETVERAKASADDVFEFATRAAFFDIGEVLEMDENGVYFKDGKKLSDLPKSIRQLIQTVKSKPTQFGIVNEIVFVDKTKHLEMLARFLGLNKDQIKVTSDVEQMTDEDLKAQLAELKGRALNGGNEPRQPIEG